MRRRKGGQRRKKRKGEVAVARRRLKKLIAAGEPLIDPKCSYTEACGGCTWQEVPYERQLELKHELVVEAFAKEGLEADVLPVRPSPRTFAYRNKMEFSFSRQRFLTGTEIASGEELRRDFALGMFGPATGLKVVDLADCPLQTDVMNELTRATRAWALARELVPFVNETQEGFLRYFLVRQAAATGDSLAVLVTSSRDEALAQDYVEWLREAGVLPTCVANGVRASRLPSSHGMTVYSDHGPSHYTERLGGLEFTLAIDAFFQVNTWGAEVLVEEVLAQAALSGSERVLDLYCGAGSLSLPLAQQAGAVSGLEVVEPAVESARFNAKANGIDNATFAVRDLNSGLPEDVGVFDLVVTDPPRAGMNLRVLQGISRIGASRVLAVGCQPSSLARNVAWLCSEGGYALTRVQPLDLFPHGPHVETLATLVRQESP
ncbi:MAG: 23S rRNA (uracil(1939)-C(5))-methyltransferase RlmD [Planctomycetes bacterium]|nr:23S rRNA (uracil(1939)-C(5))-methyltransferase RlmD [Planctomycetota bacterium]